MTAGMAFARALSDAGFDWQRLTHLSGNSGGQWFATQFAYSADTFANLTASPQSDRLSLTQILLDWAARYGRQGGPSSSAQLSAAVVNVSLQNMNKDTHAATIRNEIVQVLRNPGASACEPVAKLFAALVTTLKDIGLDAVDWETYVAVMMSTTIDGFEALTFSDAVVRKKHLPNAALVNMMALPPDAWLSLDKNSSFATLRFEQAVQGKEPMKPLTAGLARYSPGSSGSGWVVPVAHVSPASDGSAGVTDDGWLHPFAKNLKVDVWAKTPHGFVPSMAPHESYDTRLAPPESTLLKQVVASSSAAAGILASAGILDPAIRRLAAAGHLDHGLSDVAVELGIDYLVKCLPVGAQGLAVNIPLTTMSGSSLPYVKEGAAAFRAVDGAYDDNTALALTIAQMTRDCEAQRLDCSHGLNVVFVNDNEGISGVDSLVAPNGGNLEWLFSSASRPVGSSVMAPTGGSMPSPTVFKQPWSEVEAKLQPYSEVKHPLVHPFRPIQSKYALANLTTVSNPQWGVIGGYEVHAAIFDLDYGLFEEPMIFPKMKPEIMEAVFSVLFAPLVESQAKGATPVLAKWLQNQ